jgi:hypothetical protein
MKGPVPRNRFIGSNEPSRNSFMGMMELLMWATAPRNAAFGCASSMRTVRSLTATSDLKSPSCLAQYDVILLLAFFLSSSVFAAATAAGFISWPARRAKLPMTSSATTGRPLENFAPWRMVNSYVVGEVCCQLSASSGWSFASLSTVSSGS